MAPSRGGGCGRPCAPRALRCGRSRFSALRWPGRCGRSRFSALSGEESSDSARRPASKCDLSQVTAGPTVSSDDSAQARRPEAAGNRDFPYQGLRPITQPSQAARPPAATKGFGCAFWLPCAVIHDETAGQPRKLTRLRGLRACGQHFPAEKRAQSPVCAVFHDEGGGPVAQTAYFARPPVVTMGLGCAK